MHGLRALLVLHALRWYPKAMSTKPKWNVEIPIAGSVNITVSASTKKEAIATAWALINAGKVDTEHADIEWDFLEDVVQGNVCYAPCVSQTATRLPDDKLDEEG